MLGVFWNPHVIGFPVSAETIGLLQKFTEKILNEHLKTKPKWLATCGKVNRYTRAGKSGKFIICPICEQGGMVYHFSWSALQCQHCDSLITKRHWKVTG